LGMYWDPACLHWHSFSSTLFTFHTAVRHKELLELKAKINRCYLTAYDVRPFLKPTR
jgi:hypothetical protein